MIGKHATGQRCHDLNGCYFAAKKVAAIQEFAGRSVKQISGQQGPAARGVSF
jgi:hypothetical protein